MKSTLLLLSLAGSLVAITFACKPQGNSGLNEVVSASAVANCPLTDSWAGRMGFVLNDGTGGTAIKCTVEGQGLHHIGLRQGDQILALNGSPVSNGQSFESAATKIARMKVRRPMSWEFKVKRGSQTLVVKPQEEFPNCGLFVYDECGPLFQAGGQP